LQGQAGHRLPLWLVPATGSDFVLTSHVDS
jgi:hypothetical protein